MGSGEGVIGCGIWWKMRVWDLVEDEGVGSGGR